MNNEKISVSTKFWDTASAMLIVTVVFGFITYTARSIMLHQEKLHKMNGEK